VWSGPSFGEAPTAYSGGCIAPRAARVWIAKDFGISESCLRNWLHRADVVEDGVRPGVTTAEAAEIRELKRRNRLLERENEVLRRAAAYLSQANLRLGQSPE